jgi:hypothetical protein
MEMQVIPLTTQFNAVSPETGKDVKVVGVDITGVYGPKLIVLVTDVNGTHVELLDYVENKRH